ncbi:radical SAM protein [Candidatus Woesearchaeota archaeon]|nr:radical SAM protein [Candidatus Woesearchaeota archaeon]
MLVIKEFGEDEIAKVYVSEIKGHPIEFAESVAQPFQREDKWVLIVSCLFGCPVKCLMCDAGKFYNGRLSKEEILEQIDYLISKRFPSRVVPVKKFKIQFTRMGEPAFNQAVLEVLEELPRRYLAPGLIPSISTIGPKECGPFLDRLLLIKNRLYPKGKFQLQFSIHTTDIIKRRQLIPLPQMTFREIAEFGKRFYTAGDRKITLNFIVLKDYPIEPKILRTFFDPSLFIVKLTPLNPTNNARNNGLKTKLDPYNQKSISQLVDEFHSFGFDTIISIGDLQENEIGSNCGQYVSAYKSECTAHQRHS